MRIPYTASQRVLDVIGSLGRTEDIKLSSSRRRFAIAGFADNKIVVFDISVTDSSEKRNPRLTDATEVFSTALHHPHGLDFIDDETLMVANRDGDACILKLPSGEIGNGRYELAPLATIPAGDIFHSPGSVSVTKKAQNLYEALICDNYGHRVTRHLLNLKNGCSVEKSEVLLKKHLDIPDGICVSKDKKWIAISNHSSHSVLMYQNDESLDASAEPQGILKGAHYPHGLRFTSDGRFMLVADAGAPYVRIYKNDSANWRGVRYPFASYRAMSDETFMRGRYNPQEGGPKGIDILEDAGLVVTTNEWQPLALFDLNEMLNGAADDSDAQNALAVAYELDLEDRYQQAQRRALQAEMRAKRSEARVASLKKSKSWRVTAPLRWVSSAI